LLGIYKRHYSKKLLDPLLLLNRIDPTFAN
jgi:hypothetical protein